MSEVFYRAGWVMISPHEWLKQGIVGIQDGVITYVGPYDRSIHKKVRDYGPGLIMPALINAHTHLGLSCLKDKVNTTSGFLEWVKGLIAKRVLIGTDEIRQSAEDGVNQVTCTGTGLVAEVGDLEPVRSCLVSAPLDAVIFVEILGDQPDLDLSLSDEKNLILSLAGHALHTTSPRTLKRLKEITRRWHKPFSLHLAESSLETEFLATGTGPWAELLHSRGHDFSLLKPFGRRPVERAADMGLLDENTIAVHLLEVNEKEIDILARRNVKVVFCPRSNMILHNRLPEIRAFIKKGIKPALGTDSLASCPTLNMFDEMAFVRQHFPGLRPESILEMGTINGALALGRPELGSIKKGKRSKLIYVETGGTRNDDIMHYLISGEDMRIEIIDTGGQ